MSNGDHKITKMKIAKFTASAPTPSQLQFQTIDPSRSVTYVYSEECVGNKPMQPTASIDFQKYSFYFRERLSLTLSSERKDTMISSSMSPRLLHVTSPVANYNVATSNSSQDHKNRQETDYVIVAKE